MDSEDVTEISLSVTSKFMTGEELVALRKPKEQNQPSVGVKFSSRSETEMEKEAIECALETHKELLSLQRGARICDLIKAEWKEELNAVVTEKLKGKFTQHMGKKMDDKIVLSAEESLFLLESGCMEIINGKAPMSTEEAYAVMLKETMGLEKYQVYSYLSQLGFIVVPHQKELNREISKSAKTMTSKKTKRKRVNTSPLPEENTHKRLTFSGALLENDNQKVSDLTNDELNDVNSDDTILQPEDIKVSNNPLDDINLINGSNALLSKDQEPEPKTLTNVKELEDEVNETEELVSVVEKVQSSVISQEAATTSCSEIENLERNVVSESQSNENAKNSFETIPTTSYEEMNIDSESSEMIIVAEKSAETELKVGSKETDNEGTHFSDFIENNVGETADDNEQSSEVMSCSSNSASSDDFSDEENSRDVCMDDEITLVEVTKKETTPLAVIDLLSDDEEQGQALGDNDSMDSDDEIKIIKVCNGTSENGRNQTSDLLNESKLKTRKIINYKMEGRNSHSDNETVPPIQFPDAFRKNLVCVGRPFPHLLPLNVQVNKEVYVLDFDKNSSARSESRPQSQGRLWGSFRDMQEYQRARRRNRHSTFPQSRFQPWDNKSRNHQNSQPFNDFSRNQSQTYNQINGSTPRNSWTGSPRNQTTDINCDSSLHSRHSDVDYRDRNLSRERSRDTNYNSRGSSEDKKPFRTLDSSLPPFTPYPSLSDDPIPQFTNSASVNSVISIGHTGRDIGSHPVNNYSGTMMSRDHFPSSSFMGNQDFVTQVQRTAYSYATTMLSSMLGPGFNPNNLPPLLPGRNFSPHGPGFHNHFGGPQYVNDRLPYMHNRPNFGDPYRPRPVMQNPFPCMGTKRSWDDVRAEVGGNDGSSDGDSSDIEEIPINLNEFLWSVSNICPLVKPGIKHPLSELYEPLKRTKAATLTDKKSKNDKSFSENTSLEITFDVYLPGTNFKKSSPGIPKYRIIVTRSTSPVPKYNEIAFLQREWDDGAALQIAVVDAGEISFCSFKSFCLPDISIPED